MLGPPGCPLLPQTYYPYSLLLKRSAVDVFHYIDIANRNMIGFIVLIVKVYLDVFKLNYFAIHIISWAHVSFRPPFHMADPSSRSSKTRPICHFGVDRRICANIYFVTV